MAWKLVEIWDLNLKKSKTETMLVDTKCTPAKVTSSNGRAALRSLFNACSLSSVLTFPRHRTADGVLYAVRNRRWFLKKPSVILLFHHLMPGNFIFELQNIYGIVRNLSWKQAFNFFFPINAARSVVVLLSGLRALFATVRTPGFTHVSHFFVADFRLK